MEMSIILTEHELSKLIEGELKRRVAALAEDLDHDPEGAKRSLSFRLLHDRRRLLFRREAEFHLGFPREKRKGEFSVRCKFYLPDPPLRPHSGTV